MPYHYLPSFKLFLNLEAKLAKPIFYLSSSFAFHSYAQLILLPAVYAMCTYTCTFYVLLAVQILTTLKV